MSSRIYPFGRFTRIVSGHSSRILVSAGLIFGAVACSSAPPPQAPSATARTPQQEIVEASAAALSRMRGNGRFAAMEPNLERAKAVMIFPHLRKASLILGGGGGNGVLVARGADGSWSDPAFYSIGAPSVGIQIGYQEATFVLLIMDEGTLQQVLHSDFALGANSGGGVGQPSEHGRVEGEVVDRPIELFAEAGGAFVGVSLDGYVTQSRDKHNSAYYGRSVSPREILLDRAVHEPGSEILKAALAQRPKGAS